MSDVLPPGSVIRKLWVGERDIYRDHLLRLDAESRRNRFGSAVSDTFVRRHAARTSTLGTVIHGFFVDGRLRGASELRMAPPSFNKEAELAFSVERPWQSYGVGSALLERTLLTARNRGVKFLHMTCLPDNQRMQQLARKFEADLAFDFGGVTGELTARRPTALSLMREFIADGHGVASAVFDRQLRFLRPALARP
jgi:GNAT superfamily N-acetyltransferase